MDNILNDAKLTSCSCIKVSNYHENKNNAEVIDNKDYYESTINADNAESTSSKYIKASNYYVHVKDKKIKYDMIVTIQAIMHVTCVLIIAIATY